jgi:WD40 repeat protein
LVVGVNFSPDSKLALATGSNGLIKIWEVATRAEHATVRAGAEVDATSFIGSGRFLLTTGEKGVRLWEIASGQVVIRFEESEGVASWKWVVASRDGKTVVGAGAEWVTVWDGVTGEERRTLTGRVGDGPSYVTIGFTQDEKTLIAVDDSGRLTQWDVSSGQLLRAVQIGHHEVVFTTKPGGRLVQEKKIGKAALSATGNSLLISSHETAVGEGAKKAIHWLDARNGKLRQAFGGAALAGSEVALSADGLTCVTGGRQAQLWDLDRGHVVQEIKQAGGDYCPYVTISPQGDKVGVWRFRGRIGVWDVKTSQWICRVGKEEQAQLGVFTPNAKGLLVLSEDSDLSLYETASGKLARRFRSEHGQEKAVLGGAQSMAITHVGTLAATNGERSDVILWDLASGRQRRSLRGKGLHLLGSLTFSPSGKWIAGGGEDRRLRLWEVETGRQVRAFREPIPASARGK